MFCNRPDKKGVSRSDPADTFFLFRRKRENGASGRNGADAPKGEKKRSLIPLDDTLLQDVSMDVSTEIDTLEAMLRQDGLTHNFESDFNTRS